MPRRYSRLSDVWARRDRLAGVTHVADLAEQLGVRYYEIYHSIRHLGLRPEQDPTSKELALSDEQVGALRAEHARGRALHQRSMKLPAAARQLKVSFTTVRLRVANGDLELDPETDTSGARFGARASVHACWLVRNRTTPRKTEPAATVPFAEVMSYTGLGRRAVVNLVLAGVLEELPGRHATCEITTASLDKWLSDRDRACSSAESGRSAGATGRAR